MSQQFSSSCADAPIDGPFGVCRSFLLTNYPSNWLKYIASQQPLSRETIQFYQHKTWKCHPTRKSLEPKMSRANPCSSNLRSLTRLSFPTKKQEQNKKKNYHKQRNLDAELQVKSYVELAPGSLAAELPPEESSAWEASTRVSFCSSTSALCLSDT